MVTASAPAPPRWSLVDAVLMIAIALTGGLLIMIAGEALFHASKPMPAGGGEEGGRDGEGALAAGAGAAVAEGHEAGEGAGGGGEAR
jgi:hypothetical protein